MLIRIYLLSVSVIFFSFQLHATPQFARQLEVSCTHCHSVPPKLNLTGEIFLQRGYRSDPIDNSKSLFSTVPAALWVTARYEDQSSRGFSESFIPKVELISGGPLGELPLSYFVEWRLVSLQTRANGTLQDRGGRFEDAYLNWQIADRHSVKLGQFRSLAQYDVSRRLSVSEPVAFSASLPGDPHRDPRIQSLRAFSPSGRSPSIAYTFQSVSGEAPTDGLFHGITLPIVGELSVPFSADAHREASFELEGPVKGLFLETFYRKGLSSVGVHGFIDDDRWLATAVGMLNLHDFYATAAVGVDERPNTSLRNRYSMELEYLPRISKHFRPGAGFRVEYLSRSNSDPAFIPYMVLSAPNTKFALQTQLEFRFQERNDALFLDISLMF